MHVGTILKDSLQSFNHSPFEQVIIYGPIGFEGVIPKLHHRAGASMQIRVAIVYVTLLQDLIRMLLE